MTHRKLLQIFGPCKYRAVAWLMAALCAITSAAHTAEPSWQVEEFTLRNGMEVLVIPNHTVPAVNHMIWYRVGSADEPRGKEGIAHLLEHLMFRGTKNVKPGAFSEKIARVGGTDNAFTSTDYTAYFQKVAKQHLRMVMELEADRMQHLQLTPEEIAREREVVIEERHSRVESSVEGTLNEQSNLQLFQRHPYRKPIIGWEDSLQNIGAYDLRAFYKKHYHPGNAFLVVSGDVTANELKPLAEEIYGSIPAKEASARPWQSTLPATSARHVVLRHPQARQTLWSRSYMAPSYANNADDRQADALMVLWYLLGAEKTGLLYRDLIDEKQLANEVSTSYSPYRMGPSSFDIVVQPKQQANIGVIEESINFSLNQLISSGVQTAPLEQAKQALTAWQTYRLEGLQGMAFTLGALKASGLPVSHYRSYTKRIQAVTPSDVQEVARDILQPARSVTAVVQPAKD
jgi:zinc protease